MNNEIKEILEDLKNKDCYVNNETILTFDEASLLLDYITNLQQERDKYKMRCYKAYKMIFDNYGVLDKYGIDMLEDILDGRNDE